MPDGYEELFFCKPCAEEAKNYRTVKNIEYVRPARDKGTCELCGKRRFGYMCEMEFREAAELNTDEEQ